MRRLCRNTFESPEPKPTSLRNPLRQGRAASSEIPAVRITTPESSEDVNLYRYQPLDYTTQQIRLLRLLTAETDGDPIRLYIDVYDIAKAPPYTALSYTWGPPAPTYDIYIEDHDSEVVGLRVRENLYDFLLEFQTQEEKEYSDQYFWIDQISIDQSTTLERNHQVQMMSNIYSRATAVIVWLGNNCSQKDRCEAVKAGWTT